MIRSMSETGSGDLTAEGALAALSELDGYEEALTSRTAGITWVIWGTAVPGIFMTYNTANPWIEATGMGWLNALLWVPWIVGATLATNMLWKSQAVVLDTEEDSKLGWLTSLGFGVTFFAILGGVYLLGLDLGPNGIPLLVTGLLTLVMAGVYRVAWGHPATPTVVAGATIVAAAIALGTGSLAEPLAALLAAGTVAVAYYGLGGYLYARG